jgi:hypothetical protein
MVVEPDAVDDALASLGEGPVVAVIATAGTTFAEGVTWLAAPTDEIEYAQTLYAALHKADDSGVDVVIAVPPSASGLGAAVRDRLQRAATERAAP